MVGQLLVKLSNQKEEIRMKELGETPYFFYDLPLAFPSFIETGILQEILFWTAFFQLDLSMTSTE